MESKARAERLVRKAGGATPEFVHGGALKILVLLALFAAGALAGSFLQEPEERGVVETTRSFVGTPPSSMAIEGNVTDHTY